jgi:methionine-rich copper-binding protein CopC
MKKIRILTIGATLLALTGIVQAHTHLKMAMPADNSVLTSPPSQIMLHFSEATRLTALSIQKEGDKEPKIISPLPKESSAALSVPVAPLAPGKYVVNWRVVGADNHVMSGALHFTVTGK